MNHLRTYLSIEHKRKLNYPKSKKIQTRQKNKIRRKEMKIYLLNFSATWWKAHSPPLHNERKFLILSNFLKELRFSSLKEVSLKTMTRRLLLCSKITVLQTNSKWRTTCVKLNSSFFILRQKLILKELSLHHLTRKNAAKDMEG